MSAPSRQGLIPQWIQSLNLPLPVDGTGQPQDQGRWSVTFDQVRVHLLALHDDQVLLQARIIDVPSIASESEKLLTRALQTASARMRETDVGLCADPDGSALWLQVRLPKRSATHQLHQAVQRLVQEVELWRRVL
jgi:Tir chaperone protein (CesT) family